MATCTWWFVEMSTGLGPTRGASVRGWAGHRAGVSSLLLHLPSSSPPPSSPLLPLPLPPLSSPLLPPPPHSSSDLGSALGPPSL